MSLRPYQETAIAGALDALARCGSAVLQMPTGAGKTKAATEIISKAEGVVWFICHRQEIERQAAKAFREAGIDFGIVSPRAKPDYTKRVQIISVAIRDMANIPAPSLVIWDECHHVPAKSWAALHARLKDARHLGLTATPERLDGKGLKDWFAELVVGPSIETLIADGYLSPFRYFAPSDPDLTAAKLQAGDYRKRDADAAMNTPVLIGDAVAEYQRSADGKRAVAFCTSVEASKALVDRFNADGIPAAHVDGETDDDIRLAAIASLKDGSVRVLSNVNVFTEGFDVPGIEAVILMRPTKSPTLLLQMIGRALRPVEGKTAIIMDHAGLHRDHGWFANEWHWSIDGGADKARRLVGAIGPRRCPECKEVRSERLDVCGCGYEFPTGREVGEYDGVLHEVRGDVPDGCVTVAEFAAECGVSKSAPFKWMKKGLPHIGAFVKLEDGICWFQDNIKRLKPGQETLTSFAKRHFVSPAAVRSWAKRGMPYDVGVVQSEIADAWVSANIDKSLTKIRQMQVETPPNGCETQSKFAERYGVSPSAVNRWVSLGLPVLGTFVKLDVAVAWVEDNISIESSLIRSARKQEQEGYVSLKEFARRHGRTNGQSWVSCGLPITNFGVPLVAGDDWVRHHLETNGRATNRSPSSADGSVNRTAYSKIAGVSLQTIAGWVKRGMPTLPNGRILPQSAVKWAAENIKDAQTRPFWTANPEAYEQRKSFSDRMFVSENTVLRWAKRGLPCAVNGWVHIQRGLEWVRDNTTINIPPEAWPTANDNEAERITTEMHAEARRLLVGRPKKFDLAA